MRKLKETVRELKISVEDLQQDVKANKKRCWQLECPHTNTTFEELKHGPNRAFYYPYRQVCEGCEKLLHNYGKDERSYLEDKLKYAKATCADNIAEIERQLKRVKEG